MGSKDINQDFNVLFFPNTARPSSQATGLQPVRVHVKVCQLPGQSHQSSPRRPHRTTADERRSGKIGADRRQVSYENAAEVQAEF